MSKKIPDFTDSQIWPVESTLTERFKAKVETQLIDSEIRLYPHDRELTPLPVCTGKLKAVISSFSKRIRAKIVANSFIVFTSNMAPVLMSMTKSKTALSLCCAFRPTIRAIRSRKTRTNTFYINLAN